MKSLRKLWVFSWILLLAGAGAFASTSLAQTETMPQKEVSKSESKCPTVYVSCPSQNGDWQALTFAVTVKGADPGTPLTYTWTVYGGTIMQGQGTPTITLNGEDGPGNGKSLTATVNVGGLNSACASTASCSLLPGTPPPPSTRFDSYGVISRKMEMERVEAFATALKNNPGAQGYILSYDGQRDVAGAARSAGERAQAYLVKERGIEADRIVTVEGGFKEKLTIELWVVPTGATPPKPEPTIDPATLEPIKSLPKQQRP